MHVVLVAAALLLLLLTQGCFPDLRHGDEHKFDGGQFAEGEKVRLLNGEMIGRALVLFAEKNDGRFPMDLASLAPAYLGTNIDVARFTLYDAGKLKPGDLAIVAAETAKTNARSVVIRADGIAYLLRPGD